jgi:hypothetical protein
MSLFTTLQVVYNGPMKIVMHYNEGDGCTYSCDVNLPFDYDSPEQALVDFEDLFHRSGGLFVFMGQEFFKETFMEAGRVFLPSFYTLEEWFETQKIG